MNTDESKRFFICVYLRSSVVPSLLCAFLCVSVSLARYPERVAHSLRIPTSSLRHMRPVLHLARMIGHRRLVPARKRLHVRICEQHIVPAFVHVSSALGAEEDYAFLGGVVFVAIIFRVIGD